MKPGPEREPARRYSRAHRGQGGDAPAPVYIPEVSDLDVPDPLPSMKLTKPQKTIWGELWQTGPATQWGAADAHAVATLSVLLAKVYAGEATREELTECRHLRDSLGLTPASRVRLGWRAEDDE